MSNEIKKSKFGIDQRVYIPTDRLCLSIREVSASVGLSAKGIERAIARGDLRCKRVGRRILILVTEVEDWLKRK